MVQEMFNKELHDDYTTFRTVTARQLREIDNIAAIKIYNAEYDEFEWMYFDGCDTIKVADSSETLFVARFKDTHRSELTEARIYRGNDKVEIGIVD